MFICKWKIISGLAKYRNTSISKCAKAENIKHEETKVNKEYAARVTKILKSKLNGGNTVIVIDIPGLL